MQNRLFVHVFIVCICIFLTTSSRAQYYYYNDKYYSSDLVLEAGGSIGLMNCFTDLGGKKGKPTNSFLDLNVKNTKPSFSLYTLLMYKDAIGFRLEGTFGKIAAYDSIVKSPLQDRYWRNLSFRTNISEIQLGVEIHPLFFKQYEEGEAPFWSPYVVAGIGFFSFNPQANLDGRWYDLQPLHLEGQGFDEYPDRQPYKLQQFNIPVGAGIKYEANSFLNIRLEMVYRILSTDYLDDVSTTYIDPSLFANYLPANRAALAQRLYSRTQEKDPSNISITGTERGNPGKKDAFFTFQLKAGLSIRSSRRHY